LSYYYPIRYNFVVLSNRLAMPEDSDEKAIIINGKKRKLEKSDLDVFAENLKIPMKAVEKSYEKFSSNIMKADQLINSYFLPLKMKKESKTIITEAIERIEL
jgi:serine/threonine-protein kinase HipA